MHSCMAGLTKGRKPVRRLVWREDDVNLGLYDVPNNLCEEIAIACGMISPICT